MFYALCFFQKKKIDKNRLSLIESQPKKVVIVIVVVVFAVVGLVDGHVVVVVIIFGH